MAFVLILITLTLMFAIICHILAEKKGRKPAFWAVMGALFGPFAAIALAMIGKQIPDEKDPSQHS